MEFPLSPFLVRDLAAAIFPLPAKACQADFDLALRSVQRFAVRSAEKVAVGKLMAQAGFPALHSADSLHPPADRESPDSSALERMARRASAFLAPAQTKQQQQATVALYRLRMKT